MTYEILNRFKVRVHLRGGIVPVDVRMRLATNIIGVWVVIVVNNQGAMVVLQVVDERCTGTSVLAIVEQTRRSTVHLEVKLAECDVFLCEADKTW